MSAEIPLQSIKVSASAVALAGTQSDHGLHDREEVGLDDKGKVITQAKYSLLVYAPTQWGAGIREHSKGITVEAIARAFAMHSDIDAVAQSMGIGSEEVRQAIRYAVSVGFLYSSS